MFFLVFFLVWFGCSSFCVLFLSVLRVEVAVDCNSDWWCTTFDETDRGADGVDKGVCWQKRLPLSDIKVGPGKHVRVAQGVVTRETRRVSKLGSKAELKCTPSFCLSRRLTNIPVGFGVADRLGSAIRSGCLGPAYKASGWVHFLIRLCS
jgi:hypothetical protein